MSNDAETKDGGASSAARRGSNKTGRHRGRVLIVDDDADARSLLSELLEHRGFAVTAATSAEEASALLHGATQTEVVLTDLRMGGGATGVELATRVQHEHPGIPVVVITAFGSIRSAIDAIQRGAYDFLTKPYDPEIVALTLDRAVDHARSVAELRRLRASSARDGDGLVANSVAMQRVFATVERVAKSDVTVLVTGESGTGKELIARALHRQSNRAEGPFIAINCAALPEPLLESELFGHARGAFTDARTARAGLFTRASGGTLLLDEVAEMPLSMQAKLLRVLQEGRVRPVGDDHEHEVDVRVVAATHSDLEADVHAGKFREDLFFRIHVVEISLPPLRARGDDALTLAHTFLSRAAARAGRLAPTITPAVARQILSYDWPGNVRELQNAMEAAFALTEGSELGEDSLPERVRSSEQLRAPSDDHASTTAVTSVVSMEEMERRHVLFALRVLRGNKKLVAEALGLDRSTLYRKLLKYGVHEARERDDTPSDGAKPSRS